MFKIASTANNTTVQFQNIVDFEFRRRWGLGSTGRQKLNIKYKKIIFFGNFIPLDNLTVFTIFFLGQNCKAVPKILDPWRPSLLIDQRKDIFFLHDFDQLKITGFGRNLYLVFLLEFLPFVQF